MSAQDDEGRRPPRLCIDLELEQPGMIVVLAETHEDQQRLLVWLRGSAQLRALPAMLDRLLDDLEEAA